MAFIIVKDSTLGLDTALIESLNTDTREVRLASGQRVKLDKADFDRVFAAKKG